MRRSVAMLALTTLLMTVPIAGLFGTVGVGVRKLLTTYSRL